eukprot:jgi/Mesvir1/2106/Mv16636-RA.1
MASPGEGAGAAAATQAHAPGGMDVSSLARVLPSELPTVTAESLPKWTPQDLAAQNPFQLGNFTPVDGDACYPSPHLTVVGSIPPDIDGLYLRNGTNQRFHPPAGPIHMFDGDAMLHTVRLSNGQALYYARSWITTERARANISAGKDLFPVTYGLLTAGGMSALMTLAGWRKALESDEGHPARVDYPFNPSTNTLYIGGKMFAEVEVAPPLQISINPSTGQVDAVGDFDNFGDERLAAFTAHHKICPRTGELYFFGLPKYSPPPKRVPPSPTATADSAPAGPPEHGEGNLQPQGGVDGGHASEAASGAASPAAPVQSQDDVVLFGVLTPQGELAHLTRFPLASPPGVQSPLLLHDYFLTENYAVVVDHSMRMDIGGMAQGRPAPVWDDRCKIRFGVCPRRPAGPHDIRWLSDNATCGFLWHIVNGWEETHTRDGGVKETVLTLFFCMFESYPGSVPIHLSEEPPSHLTKWTLNLATGQVAHQRVAATCGAAMERNDINRAYLGHPGSPVDVVALHGGAARGRDPLVGHVASGQVERPLGQVRGGFFGEVDRDRARVGLEHAEEEGQDGLLDPTITCVRLLPPVHDMPQEPAGGIVREPANVMGARGAAGAHTESDLAEVVPDGGGAPLRHAPNVHPVAVVGR